MQYWLIKSEPEKYSYSRLEADGITMWDGIRNYAARNFLRTMQKGDLALFYHSNEGKEVVGIAKVANEWYPEPNTNEQWSVVDFEPYRKLAHPVTLDTMRNHPVCNGMEMFRLNRLSVTPVTRQQFDAVLELAGQ